MSDDQTRYKSDSTSHYPVSRLAPPFTLVDLAREIAHADEMLSNRAGSKLEVIARQVRLLQEQAQEILEQTRRDQQLHRARCSFQKKPGQIYHLYRDRRDQPLLSLLSPADWRGRPPHRFEGSFRLESDSSWTPVDEIETQAQMDPLKALQALLARQVPE